MWDFNSVSFVVHFKRERKKEEKCFREFCFSSHTHTNSPHTYANKIESPLNGKNENTIYKEKNLLAWINTKTQSFTYHNFVMDIMCSNRFGTNRKILFKRVTYADIENCIGLYSSLRSPFSMMIFDIYRFD